MVKIVVRRVMGLNHVPIGEYEGEVPRIDDTLEIQGMCWRVMAIHRIIDGGQEVRAVVFVRD